MPFVKGKSGNAAGRPKGAKGRVPSDKDIKDGFLSSSSEALEKLKHLMRNGGETTQFKCAVKILDTSVQIIYEDEKMKLSSKKKDGSEISSELEEESQGGEKKTGTGGVVRYLNTKYIPPKEEKESEEDSD